MIKTVIVKLGVMKITAQSLPKILRVASDVKSLIIFQSIAFEGAKSDVILKKTNLTRKQYYSRISAILDAGLATKKNNKYSLTSLGKVVYWLQLTAQNALDNYWKLKAIDSFDCIPEREREQMIKNFIGDNDLTELLTRKYAGILTSNVIEGSHRQQQHDDDHHLSVGQQPDEKKPINLIVVDDEPDVLLAFKNILISQGYNVDAFTDSYEAIKHFIKLDRPYYQLLIVDIRMPRMNGIQLYQVLKSIDNDLRVIFISALDAAGELVSILPDLKSSQIMRKPISNDDLINIIRMALT